MSKMRAAFIYDFDDTLINGNMQEHKLLAYLKTTPAEFWAEVYEFTKENNMDPTASFLYYLTLFAKRNKVKLNREFFAECGHDLPFFNGVETFFDRINEYAEKNDIELEHYIVSTGNREIIVGSSIGEKFKRIFASEYCYNKKGEPVWISHNISYSEKTQYIARIRKGLLDRLYDGIEVNTLVRDTNKLIPYSRMVYFGDGYTDVPSMKMVTGGGGNAICVYTDKNKESAKTMLEDERVTFIAPADYSEGSKIEQICKSLLRQISLKNS